MSAATSSCRAGTPPVPPVRLRTGGTGGVGALAALRGEVFSMGPLGHPCERSTCSSWHGCPRIAAADPKPASPVHLRPVRPLASPQPPVFRRENLQLGAERNLRSSREAYASSDLSHPLAVSRRKTTHAEPHDNAPSHHGLTIQRRHPDPIPSFLDPNSANTSVTKRAPLKSRRRAFPPPCLQIFHRRLASPLVALPSPTLAEATSGFAEAPILPPVRIYCQ